MSLNLDSAVLNRRVFNKNILKQHVRSFMLGQTKIFMDPHKNVIDVGAAVGMYTSYWAQQCKNIYSFEAVPAVYQQLCKLKPIFPNLHPINKAVCSEVGTKTFYVDDKRLSNNSFSNLVDGQKIQVKATTIDSENLNNIGFIKIDVEGHELDVLLGASKTIIKNRPVCMVEIYPKFLQCSPNDIFQYFFSKSYRCYYNVLDKGLRPVLGVEEGNALCRDVDMIKLHDGDFIFVPLETL